MSLKSFKPVTPSNRYKVWPSFDEITTSTPEKSLCRPLKKSGGRNNNGRITTRHQGGGVKRRYRVIDFKRNKFDVPATVLTIEYDPNRTCRIALIEYKDGEKSYILAPTGLQVGMKVESGQKVAPKVGNAMPLKNVPLGTSVHNIEIRPGSGGKVARAAGPQAIVSNREAGYALIKMPSGEIRRFNEDCYCTIGQVGNIDAENICIGKAGRSRWLGIRPANRGVVMNPNDHPHGGGEGHSPVGRKRPVTPWGKCAFGTRTRKEKKASSKLIVKRRTK